MPWTINSEIYTRSHRALANSASTSTNWLSNFVVAMTFLSLSRALSRQGGFALYACITTTFALFFYMYLPEPKGVPLEEVPLLFSDSHWGRARHKH
jgi:SP family myo-inositol transporter-like MFS transporter 13